MPTDKEFYAFLEMHAWAPYVFDWSIFLLGFGAGIFFGKQLQKNRDAEAETRQSSGPRANQPRA